VAGLNHVYLLHQLVLVAEGLMTTVQMEAVAVARLSHVYLLHQLHSVKSNVPENFPSACGSNKVYEFCTANTKFRF